MACNFSPSMPLRPNSPLNGLTMLFNSILIASLYFMALFSIEPILQFRYKLSNNRVQSRTILHSQIRKQRRECLQQKTMTRSQENANKELRSSVVGVDFGSAFTKISAIEKGTVDILTNQANLRQTPTIVGYGSKERLIGEEGSVKLKSNLNNSIIAPQRYLAVKSEAYLQEEGKFNPIPLINQENKRFFKVQAHNEEIKILPEQAVAAFFTKLQGIVELNHINNKYLTVSVPNYLTNSEKQALLDAIEISKKSGKHQYGVQLATESTAVGLDYGYYKKQQFPEKEEEAKDILFIDFGHSKLSLYVIKFTKNYQKVMYQKHLKQFGCKNMDDLMLDFYSQIFEKNNPSLEITVRESKKATFKLLQNIEKQRKVLSGNSEYDFNIDCLLEDCDISYSMKRQEFEFIISPVLNQAKSFFEQARTEMEQLGLVVSTIELIGGGSRIPAFIRCVSESFQMEPSRTLNSSECIARGAGLFSAMNSGSFRMQPYHSFEQSLETIICQWKEQGKEMVNQMNQQIILRAGELIYSKKTLELNLPVNVSNMLSFSLVSKEFNSEEISPLCKFNISLPAPLNSKKSLKIHFEFNTNNMVSHVSAFLIDDHETPIQIREFQHKLHLLPSQIANLTAIEKEQAQRDLNILQYYENKNRFQSSLYQMKNHLNNFISAKESTQYVNQAHSQEMLNYFEHIQCQIDKISNFQEELRQVNARLVQFYKMVDETKKKQIQFEKQINKFIGFIESIANGKLRRSKHWPLREIEEAQEWIKQFRAQQKNIKKYDQTSPILQVLKEKHQVFKQAIEKYEEELAKEERQANQQYYYQTQRPFEQRQHLNDPYGFNPFRNTYHPRQNQARNRGRGRNNSFNGYNSGIFSGFPDFF